MKMFLITLILGVLFCISASAQQFDHKQTNTLRAFFINSEIEIDGDLDEDPWQKAQVISNFTQRELHEGQPATEKTEVAILYSETHLYIGISAFDSDPEKIIAKESIRDFSWGTEDNFEIILGPFDDNRNAFLFVINPNGAMADVLVTDDGNGINKDWNGVWEAEVEVDEEGWFAEIEIPFSTLKFPEQDEQVWALNMERNIRRKNEQVLWQGWSRNYELEKISQAGKLIGLKGIRSARPWEFKPYITAGFEKKESKKTLGKFNAGGDINYHFSPKMKLNLTINTDFSQVESDREEINLTRFDIMYPEKRDFFLDGKNLFDFNLGQDAQMFYSRRIGLHDRQELPIIGGLRLVGKASDSNFGVMSLQTSSKDSVPTKNFSVIRLKQDVLEQSSVGFMLTSLNDAKHYNYVYGVDANYATSEFMEDKNFEVGAAFSQSITEFESNKDNFGYKAYVNYPNDFAEFDLYVSRISKNYNPESGFLRRKDYRMYFSELALSPRPGELIPFIKNFEIIPFELDYYFTDHNHKLESVQMEFRPLGFELMSGDGFEFNIQRFYDRLDEEFEIIDDTFISANDYWFTRYEVGFESFTGRKVFTESQISWGNFYNGKRVELESAWGLNLSRNMNISADWEHNYIELIHKKFTTDELGGRFEYAFSPRMVTSLFGQWNNEDNEVLINFRVNWIPKTGSYFYFVLNQEYETTGSVQLMNTTVLSKLVWLFSM